MTYNVRKTWGNSGGLIFLDRISIYCPDDQFMTAWRPNQLDDDHWQMIYNCSSFTTTYSQSLCISKNTGYNEPGNAIAYLDRHSVSCGKGMGLVGWNGATIDLGSNSYRFRFEYKCCAAIIPSIPTATPTFSPTTSTPTTSDYFETVLESNSVIKSPSIRSSDVFKSRNIYDLLRYNISCGTSPILGFNYFNNLNVISLNNPTPILVNSMFKWYTYIFIFAPTITQILNNNIFFIHLLKISGDLIDHVSAQNETREYTDYTRVRELNLIANHNPKCKGNSIMTSWAAEVSDFSLRISYNCVQYKLVELFCSTEYRYQNPYYQTVFFFNI